MNGKMSLKDWAGIVGMSAALVVVLMCVMMGLQAVAVDTGRQILGK